jgi:hypothetical protein
MGHFLGNGRNKLGATSWNEGAPFKGRKVSKELYKRLWEGRVRAVKVDGRWLILITPTGGGPRSPERDCKASAREAGCGQV